MRKLIWRGEDRNPRYTVITNLVKLSSVITWKVTAPSEPRSNVRKDRSPLTLSKVSRERDGLGKID